MRNAVIALLALILPACGSETQLSAQRSDCGAIACPAEAGAMPPDVGADGPPDVAADLPPLAPDLPPAPFQSWRPCNHEGDYVAGNFISVVTPAIRYEPACLKVAPGTTVQFGMDLSIHPLRPSTDLGDAATNPIPSRSTGPGVAVTFPTPGFFAYHCAYHPIEGVVWVTDGPLDAGTGERLDAAPGNLDILPVNHEFPPTEVGQSSDTFTFTARNLGMSLGGFDVSVTGNDFVIPAAGNHCAGLNALGTLASCTFDVVFRPTSRGIKSGTVLVTAGGQAVSATLLGTGQAPARLAASPQMLTFTGVANQTGQPVPLTVANVGDAPTGPVAVTLVGADAGSFQIASNGCLAPLVFGASCTIKLAFNPSTAGMKGAALTVSSSPGGMFTVQLAGTAVPLETLTISPNAADFRSLAVGETSNAQAFEVTNIGGSPTPPLTVSVSPGEFVLTANTCTGLALSPGATCGVSVIFKPVSLGQRLGTLTIAGGSGGGGHIVQALLSGLGLL